MSNLKTQSSRLRGGYTQRRETSSFLDLETSFLVHICILGQNGVYFGSKWREKNAKLFLTPSDPPQTLIFYQNWP